MPRLFVAAWPPPDVVGRLAALPCDDENVRWVPPGRWHVTLRFLGDADLDAATSALERVDATRATVTLGPRVSLLGGTVVVVPAAGLDRIAAAVADATAGIGTADEARPFHGHLTLGRLRRPGLCRLVGHPVDGEFPVEELTLVRSETHPDGARYTTCCAVGLVDR